MDFIDCPARFVAGDDFITKPIRGVNEERGSPGVTNREIIFNFNQLFEKSLPNIGEAHFSCDFNLQNKSPAFHGRIPHP